MAKYRVREIVIYEDIVEAKDKEEAYDNYYQVNARCWTEKTIITKVKPTLPKPQLADAITIDK